MSISELLAELDLSGEGPVGVPDFLGGAAIEDFSFDFGSPSGGPSFDLECVARLNGSLTHPTQSGETGDESSSIGFHVLQEGRGAARVDGRLTLGGLDFDMTVSERAGAQVALGVYHDPVGAPMTLATVLRQVIGDEPGGFGEGVELTLHDAVVAVVGGEGDEDSKVMLAVDLGAGLSLSDLPLVGRQLPLEDSVRMAYRLLVTSTGTGPEDIASVNHILAERRLAPRLQLEPGAAVAIAARLELGDEVQLLDLPLSVADTSAEPAEGLPVVADSTAASDGVTWRAIQRDVGPLYLGRLGASFADGEITFLLDASLGAAGLRLGLQGLSLIHI